MYRSNADSQLPQGRHPRPGWQEQITPFTAISNPVNSHSDWERIYSASIDTVFKRAHTVYPKKYAHGFIVLCFVVVMQSFIMNSHELFIHIHQGCFAGTGAIVRLPQCQWSKPDGYGKISQCITTTKHSKAKTACIFLGIYCTVHFELASGVELWCFLWSAPVQRAEQAIETPLIWDTIALIMTSL